MQDNHLPFKIGTLIRDGDKIGIIYREIKSGTWTEEPLFNWRTNYEIYYDDGSICVMGSDTIQRLVDSGKIELIEGRKNDLLP
tara:strand:+ start:251 stop:499 length:249 start_codon:yes stop_codon:yes gene_type:complete